MPKLYSSREVVNALKRAKFVEVSQRGSHLKMKGIWDNKLQTVIVPLHKEIRFGTFRGILNQAGMSKSEFEHFLK